MGLNSIVGILAVKTKLSFLTQLPPTHPHHRSRCLAQAELRSPEGPVGLEILGCSLVPASGTTCRGRPTGSAFHSSFSLVLGGVIPLLLFVINHAVYSHSILGFRHFFSQRTFYMFSLIFYSRLTITRRSSLGRGEMILKFRWETVVQTILEGKRLDS